MKLKGDIAVATISAESPHKTAQVLQTYNFNPARCRLIIKSPTS
jgi:hypothetical protein